ncbi:hypothetical protein B0H12DRAFT_110072 [Mycena haematopus]|nr:hypothetical protein B0H12DRAFT_110072 [Mycena haematopus]
MDLYSSLFFRRDAEAVISLSKDKAKGLHEGGGWQRKTSATESADWERGFFWHVTVLQTLFWPSFGTFRAPKLFLILPTSLLKLCDSECATCFGKNSFCRGPRIFIFDLAVGRSCYELTQALDSLLRNFSVVVIQGPAGRRAKARNHRTRFEWRLGGLAGSCPWL